jgi:uncharacterized protein YecE (DUF72 family)
MRSSRAKDPPAVSGASLFVGTAGWSIPKAHAGGFLTEGSHLVRYAAQFNAVEINSSFYRPHRRSTYERWARTVPQNFRFAVKVPKAITHEARLVAPESVLDRFLGEVAGLGDRLGPLLVQLPPSLAFDEKITTVFFAAMRDRFSGSIVCEARHPTWFVADAIEQLLTDHRVARVAADPAVVPTAANPGGWDRLVYYRLHGSPRLYYSAYPPEYLDRLVMNLNAAARTAEVWCIFDNTASGAAIANAKQVALDVNQTMPVNTGLQSL